MKIHLLYFHLFYVNVTYFRNFHLLFLKFNLFYEHSSILQKIYKFHLVYEN